MPIIYLWDLLVEVINAKSSDGTTGAINSSSMEHLNLQAIESAEDCCWNISRYCTFTAIDTITRDHTPFQEKL